MNNRKILLIAICITLTLQAMRPFFTLIVNNYGERTSLLNAAPITLGVFLSPFLAPLLARFLNPKRTLYLVVGSLAVLRVVMQLMPTPESLMVVSAMTTVVGLMSLPLLLAWMRGANPDESRQEAYYFALGLLFGVALDSVLQAVFLSWDYVWQRDVLPLVLAFAVSAVCLWCLRNQWGDVPHEASFMVTFPAALIGVCLVVNILFLHNLGYIAARGLSLPLSVGLVLVSDVLGLVVLHFVAQRALPAYVRWLCGVLAIALVTILPQVTGLPAVALFLLTQVVTLILLFGALAGASSTPRTSSLWRTGVAIGLGTLLPILPAVIYFVGQNQRLPFAPEMAYPFLGVLLALGALVNPVSQKVKVYRLERLLSPLLALLLVAVYLFVRVSFPGSVVELSDSFRIMDYNLHYGINTDGMADPEGLARVIEAQNPDVVTLQEVSRGWLIGGSVEMLEWLSIRLEMPYVSFAPAADTQFGNAILSRIPFDEVAYGVLPTENIPQRRSFQVVALNLNGQTVTLINTHLSAWVGPESHVAQVQMLLDAWNSAPYTLITGDMNSQPGAVDIQMFYDAGFDSAQDQAGDPEAFTANSRHPDVRIDFIFGTSDLTFSNFVIPQSQASDHFSQAATVTLR
ncbi:MAG: endonuclease/exonuclease/phosphatase family protein [Anaerolineae bacterium]